MKLLKRGGPPIDEWKAEIECGRCKSVLEIDAVDLRVQRDPHDRMMGEFVDWWSVQCPACEHTIPVSGIPITVEVELRKKLPR